MAIARLKVHFDLSFEDIIELDTDHEIAIFDLLPQHVKKKYNLDVKGEDIYVDDVYEVDEFGNKIKEEEE